MAATQFFMPFPMAFNSNGFNVSGARLHFYASGTNTHQSIYANASLTIELANPVVANAAGRIPAIYLDSLLGNYRVVITNDDGAPLGVDVDPYVPSASSQNVTDALNARNAAIAAQGRAEAAEEGAEDARDIALAAASDAADNAQVVPYRSWTALSGVTGAPGDLAQVLAGNGTHTDPVVGGTVDDQGLYAWSASPAGWERIEDTAAVRASASAAAAQTYALGTTRILDGYDQTEVTGTEVSGNPIIDGSSASINRLRFLNDPLPKGGLVTSVTVYAKTTGTGQAIRFYEQQPDGTFEYRDEVTLSSIGGTGSNTQDVSAQAVTVQAGWFAAHTSTSSRVATNNGTVVRVSSNLSTSDPITPGFAEELPSFSVSVYWEEAADQGAVKEALDTIPEPSRNGIYGLTAANTSFIRQALADVRKGAGWADVLILGDSITAGSHTGTNNLYTGARDRNFSAQLAGLLAGTYPDGLMLPVTYESFLGANNIQGTYPAYNPRVSSVGDWGETSTNPSFSSLGGEVWHSDTPGGAALVFAPVADVDTFELRLYTRTTAGKVEWRVDGGAWAEIDLADDDGYLISTIDLVADLGLVPGQHTIEVRHASGGDVYLAGIMAYNSQVPSVRITPAGFAGSTSYSWAGVYASPWSPLNRVRDEVADLKVLAFGTNDIDDGQTVDEYRRDMGALIDAAKLASSVLVLGPPPQLVDGGNSTQARQDEFRQALFDLCATKKVPFLDQYGWFGDYATADAVGLMDDSLHPTYAGATVQAAALLEYFKRVS